MEYVLDDVRPVPARPLSPPVCVAERKRARFRPRSPDPEQAPAAGGTPTEEEVHDAR